MDIQLIFSQKKLGHPVIFAHLLQPPPERLLDLVLLHLVAPGQLADQLLLTDVLVITAGYQQQIVMGVQNFR